MFLMHVLSSVYICTQAFKIDTNAYSAPCISHHISLSAAVDGNAFQHAFHIRKMIVPSI